LLFILNNCVVKYAYLIWKFDIKYLYMSQTQRHIKSHNQLRGILCYIKAYKCDLYFNGNYGNWWGRI